jgi:hypothetical protein
MATNNELNTNVATQAQQETGSALTAYVAPGVQQYHPSAAKAWLQATTGGGASASFNIASVTDIGVGIVGPNWSVDFSSANYVVAANVRVDSSATAATTNITTANDTDFLAGSCTIVNVRASDYATIDPNFTLVSAYGDQ